jgi:hypothetical protein
MVYMWREGLGVEYPADHSPYADPTLYYPPGKIHLHSQNSTPRFSAKVSDQYLRQKHPANSRITAEGWILADRKSVEDSIGVVHRSMRAWRKFLGVSNSYKARYDGGRYDLQEPTDVAKAIQEDQAMVANLLDLAKGEAATVSTLPPSASGNGLQDSSVEADPEQTQQGRSTNQHNAPTEVSIEEDVRQERREEAEKRLRRAEKSHRHPHIPGECPRCQAAIAARANDPGSDSTGDNPPKQVERQGGSSWASAQELVQWLEANTAVSGGGPPPQPDRERPQRPLQTDGYPRHEQHSANPLDHDRLLNEQRERLKQQAALEDGEEPSARPRWNGYRPPREETLRLREEKKSRNRAARAGANRAYKRQKVAMQEKRHQDMNARRYQAELAEQKRRRD